MTSSDLGSEHKRSTLWQLEDWAVRDGVQSTTRYRKQTPSRRSAARALGDPYSLDLRPSSNRTAQRRMGSLRGQSFASSLAADVSGNTGHPYPLRRPNMSAYSPESFVPSRMDDTIAASFKSEHGNIPVTDGAHSTPGFDMTEQNIMNAFTQESGSINPHTVAGQMPARSEEHTSELQSQD